MLLATSTMNPTVMIVLYGNFWRYLLLHGISSAEERKKRVDEMMAGLAIGDSILTSSGFYGVIIDMTDDTVIVEFGSNKTAASRCRRQQSYRLRSRRHKIVNENEPGQRICAAPVHFLSYSRTILCSLQIFRISSGHRLACTRRHGRGLTAACRDGLSDTAADGVWKLSVKQHLVVRKVLFYPRSRPSLTALLRIFRLHGYPYWRFPERS